MRSRVSESKAEWMNLYLPPLKCWNPDFIYRMSGNIEVHYSLFSVEFQHLAGRNRRQRHNHLLLQLDQNVLLTDNLIVMRLLRQDNTCSGTILLQRYELYSEMDSYCLVLLGQQTLFNLIYKLGAHLQ